MRGERACGRKSRMRRRKSSGGVAWGTCFITWGSCLRWFYPDAISNLVAIEPVGIPSNNDVNGSWKSAKRRRRQYSLREERAVRMGEVRRTRVLYAWAAHIVSCEKLRARGNRGSSPWSKLRSAWVQVPSRARTTPARHAKLFSPSSLRFLQGLWRKKCGCLPRSRACTLVKLCFYGLCRLNRSSPTCEGTPAREVATCPHGTRWMWSSGERCRMRL